MCTFKYNIVDCFSAATVVTPKYFFLERGELNYKGVFSLCVVIFKMFITSHIGGST